MSIPRAISPVCVTDPMYLRRFGAFDHGGRERNGARNIHAYCLYGTMNRLAYGVEHWGWNPNAVDHNLSIIAEIRAGQLNMNMTEGFVCPDLGTDEDFVPLPAGRFWQVHGIQVRYEAFLDQEREIDAFDASMLDATEAVEDAHVLWNLYDDGENHSVGTFDADMSDLSDTE